jgi:phosphoglycolate phosphatase-like HAD superfamily hydrolase
VPLALFDLDNTLADREAAFLRWLTGFLAHHRVPEESMSSELEADGDGFVPRTVFFQRVRERLGLADSVEDLLASYATAYPQSYAREAAPSRP